MKSILEFMVSILLLIFCAPTMSNAGTITYCGKITETMGWQPYAHVDDDLSITVEYDEIAYEPIDITIYIESWGDMYPSNADKEYYNSSCDWNYHNTGTAWTLDQNKFILESDNFGAIIYGYVEISEAIPLVATPEPSTLMLIFSGLFCGLYRKSKIGLKAILQLK